jgi:hypothetical protein
LDRNTFAEHLRIATLEAVAFARTYVRQDLLGEVAYHVVPNHSFDVGPQPSNVVTYPEDMLGSGERHARWSATQVIAYLWRDGLIPCWIDVSVIAADSPTTIVELACCGRFTNDDSILYYRHTSRPPFGVKSPTLPPGWIEGERFDIAVP